MISMISHFEVRLLKLKAVQLITYVTLDQWRGWILGRWFPPCFQEAQGPRQNPCPFVLATDGRICKTSHWGVKGWSGLILCIILL